VIVIVIVNAGRSLADQIMRSASSIALNIGEAELSDPGIQTTRTLLSMVRIRSLAPTPGTRDIISTAGMATVDTAVMAATVDIAVMATVDIAVMAAVDTAANERLAAVRADLVELCHVCHCCCEQALADVRILRNLGTSP
jgi:hypothetical protein